MSIQPGTPLPWDAIPFQPNKLQEQLVRAAEYDVATVHAYSRGTEQEAAANAAYIVRACNSFPDLLEALQTCVEVRDRIDSGDDENLPDFDEWLANARAAIRKATGDSQ